jgi:hypothetical protein
MTETKIRRFQSECQEALCKQADQTLGPNFQCASNPASVMNAQPSAKWRSRKSAVSFAFFSHVLTFLSIYNSERKLRNRAAARGTVEGSKKDHQYAGCKSTCLRGGVRYEFMHVHGGTCCG